MHLRIFASITACAALLSGCATREKAPAPAPAAATKSAQTDHNADYAAKLENTPGSPKIRLSIGDQRAYYSKGGEVVVSSRISTGKPGHETPKGSYRVTQKVQNYVSNSYGKIVDSNGATVTADADSRTDSVPAGGRFVGAPMPYFMRFNGGIGMHAGHVPDYPASHGCVRLPRSMAKLFFEHTPVGTPVIVTD